MRKRKTHSARTLGKKSAGRRGSGKLDAYAPMIVLCALGAGILAAGYGLTYQSTPVQSAKAPPIIAIPKEDKAIAAAPSAAPAIQEQAARKEDGVITGSLPKDQTTPSADAKTKPQAAKKKKPATTAKVEQPKNFFDFFNTGQQKR